MIVKFAIRETTENESIDVLELSNRSANGLKRAGITKIGEVIDKWDDIPKLHGMGVTSIKDIGDKIMNLVIKEMTDEQLLNFWYLLINNNSAEDLKISIKGD